MGNMLFSVHLLSPGLANETKYITTQFISGPFKNFVLRPLRIQLHKIERHAEFLRNPVNGGTSDALLTHSVPGVGVLPTKATQYIPVRRGNA